MGNPPRHRNPDTTASPSADERHSPKAGGTLADGGYAEPHGPRVDAEGWGEANPRRGGRDTDPGSQAQQTADRSYDGGPDDPPGQQAAQDAARDAALREPGERGAGDARPPRKNNEDAAQEDVDSAPPDFDGRQRDYGQGGGQGYVNTGKPGAPGPDDTSD